MKRSAMAWIAWYTTSVTCSKNLISLEFFANFLFQDKKLGGSEASEGVQPQVLNIKWFVIKFDQIKTRGLPLATRAFYHL
jgi:hypothetical protein